MFSNQFLFFFKGACELAGHHLHGGIQPLDNSVQLVKRLPALVPANRAKIVVAHRRHADNGLETLDLQRERLPAAPEPGDVRQAILVRVNGRREPTLGCRVDGFDGAKRALRNMSSDPHGAGQQSKLGKDHGY